MCTYSSREYYKQTAGLKSTDKVLVFVTLQVLSSVVLAAEMANEALEKVEERLNCSICLDTYTDPKLLQWCHWWCETSREDSA